MLASESDCSYKTKTHEKSHIILRLLITMWSFVFYMCDVSGSSLRVKEKEEFWVKMIKEKGMATNVGGLQKNRGVGSS